jgi:transposase-like protein
MSNLTQKHFHDNEAARKYLERTLWPDGPICPHCGTIDNAYATKKTGLYRCGSAQCRKDFTVTVGTVFERSKIALHKWLLAAYLVCSSKKGMSTHQLHRTLDVTYKTAWFMSHRLREAMKTAPSGQLGGSGKGVEADETFWGNNNKRPAGQRGYEHKMKVLSLVERKGQVRSFQVPMVNGRTLMPILRAHIAQDTKLYTDEGGQYHHAKKDFLSHDVVVHSKGEYSRGDANTNSVEGYFSILKRGLIGTFHHVGEQHLQRYMHEFDFRYNHRTALGFNDEQRTVAALKGITGKRLTYKPTKAHPAQNEHHALVSGQAEENS